MRQRNKNKKTDTNLTKIGRYVSVFIAYMLRLLIAVEFPNTITLLFNLL